MRSFLERGGDCIYGHLGNIIRRKNLGRESWRSEGSEVDINHKPPIFLCGILP